MSVRRCRLRGHAGAVQAEQLGANGYGLQGIARIPGAGTVPGRLPGAFEGEATSELGLVRLYIFRTPIFLSQSTIPRERAIAKWDQASEWDQA